MLNLNVINLEFSQGLSFQDLVPQNMRWEENKGKWTGGLNISLEGFLGISCSCLHVTEWLRLEGTSRSHLLQLDWCICYDIEQLIQYMPYKDFTGRISMAHGWKSQTWYWVFTVPEAIFSLTKIKIWIYLVLMSKSRGVREIFISHSYLAWGFVWMTIYFFFFIFSPFFFLKETLKSIFSKMYAISYLVEEDML